MACANCAIGTFVVNTLSQYYILALQRRFGPDTLGINEEASLSDSNDRISTRSTLLETLLGFNI